jgi:PD-(D/E)XK nuclease superfamily
VKQIRISGKNLGQFALPNACPRCLWLTLHCQNKFPYQKFPGIFSSIDGYTKRFVFAHFEKYKRIPSWLRECGDIGKPIKAPTHHTFNFVEPKTNIMLTGDPDAVFQAKGGFLSILDYKTAKFTKTQDELLPIYVTQLNAYAFIAEHIGMGRIKHLALVYCEPKTEVDTSCIEAISADQGFLLEFSAKILPIELNLESIPPLLARVRQFGDMATAPKGRNDCKECRLVDNLVAAVSIR